MPYPTNADLPDSVKNVLPDAAQTIWREAFNSAMDGGKSEQDAMQIAWAACKNAGYEKMADGMWGKPGSATVASMVSTLRAVGNKGEADVRVLLNRGAGMSFVLRSVAERLATLIDLPRPIRITLADGKTTATITKGVSLIIEAAGQQIIDMFIVLESALNDVILGEATMRKFGLKIDMERSVVFSEIKTNPEDKSMWKKFLALLGIAVSEEVTEEKAAELIKAKIQADPAKIIASKGVLSILGLAATATEDEVKGKILALKDRGDVVSRAEHEKLQAQVHEQEVEQVIAAAMQEGKITPAMKPATIEIAKEHGLATLKSYVAGLPKIVPLGQKLPERKEDKAAGKIDDAQTAVNKQLGISEATFLKYNATA